MFKCFCVLGFLFSGILIFSFTGCSVTAVSNPDQISFAHNEPANIPEVSDFVARLTNVSGHYWRVTKRLDFHSIDTSNFRLPNYLLVTNKSFLSKFPGIIGLPIDFRDQYPEYSISSIDFVDDKRGFIALNKFSTGINDTSDLSKIIKTTNGRKSWETVYENRAIMIATVVFVNEDIGWAIGRRLTNESYFDRRYLALQTLDRGETWNDVSEPINQLVLRQFKDVNDELTALHADDVTTATALSLNGRLFRTTDSGKSWNQFTVLPSEPLQTCLCQIGRLESGEIWVSGGANSIEGQWGVIAILGHDGRWTRNRLPNMSFNQIKFVSDSSVFAAGAMFDQTKGKKGRQRAVILFSGDLGKNWQVIYKSQQADEFVSLTISSTERIEAIDSTGRLISIEK